MIKLFMLIFITLVAAFIGYESSRRIQFELPCKTRIVQQVPQDEKVAPGVKRSFNLIQNIESNVYALVFYGRKQQFSILYKYLLPNLKVNGGVLEKIVFCVKTNKTEDLAYLDEIMEEGHSYFERVYSKNNRFTTFYQLLGDDDLVFKIDDDVVFIKNGTFERMLEEYVKKNATILSGNVVNHPVLSQIHAINRAILWFYEEPQYNWILNETAQEMNPICMNITIDSISKWWFHPGLAAIAHESFLHHIYNNNLDVYNFGRFDFHTQGYSRWSINFVLFRGKYVNKMRHFDDEKQVSRFIPEKLDRHAYALGSTLVAHFSYYKQYAYLLNTTIMDKYRQLAEDYFSIL